MRPGLAGRDGSVGSIETGGQQSQTEKGGLSWGVGRLQRRAPTHAGLCTTSTHHLPTHQSPAHPSTYQAPILYPLARHTATHASVVHVTSSHPPTPPSVQGGTVRQPRPGAVIATGACLGRCVCDTQDGAAFQQSKDVRHHSAAYRSRQAAPSPACSGRWSSAALTARRQGCSVWTPHSEPRDLWLASQQSSRWGRPGPGTMVPTASAPTPDRRLGAGCRRTASPARSLPSSLKAVRPILRKSKAERGGQPAWGQLLLLTLGFLG